MNNLIYEPAGLLKRVIAFFIDYHLTLFLVCFFLLLDNPSGATDSWLFVLLVFWFWVFYLFLKDALFDGQSLGKKILGLKVVDFKDQTKPCNLIQSIKRNFV